MKIETQLNIDDEAYFINEGIITKGKIISIDIKIVNVNNKGVSGPKEIREHVLYQIKVAKTELITTREEKIVGKSQEDLFNKIRLEK